MRDCIQSGSSGSGTVNPEKKNTAAGRIRLTPSPDTVQSKEMVITVAMAALKKMAVRQENKKANPWPKEAGALRWKNRPAIRKSGIARRSKGFDHRKIPPELGPLAEHHPDATHHLHPVFPGR